MSGFSRRKPFAFGGVEPRLRSHAEANGIVLASNFMYMSAKSLSHARRLTKTNLGLAVSVDDMCNFPTAKADMDLFWDGESYIYTDYRNKFIIHPNYTIKMPNGKRRRVAFITSGKVNNPSEFSDRIRYKKV